MMRCLLALAVLFQAAGDKVQVSLDSSLELDIVIRDGQGETTRLLNLNRREKYSQEKIDEKSFRIRCLSSTLQKSGTDTPIEERPTALSGGTFTATRTPSGWDVKEASGSSAPLDAGSLGAWNDVSRLLPAAGGLTAGAKWTVEGKDLLPLLYPASLREGTAKMECSCDSVEGGKAMISFTGLISGKGRDESISKLALTITAGNLVYDTSKNSPVSLRMAGSLETVMDIIDITRRPGTGAIVGNEEEKRKVGEISIKSRKLEATFTFE